MLELPRLYVGARFDRGTRIEAEVSVLLYHVPEGAPAIRRQVFVIHDVDCGSVLIDPGDIGIVRHSGAARRVTSDCSY